MNEYPTWEFGMDRSPKGRTIVRVKGTPSTIISRGTQIEALGTEMLDSAELLMQIATRTVDDESQKGEAIKKLRESIGDSHETLRRAGELYEPVGPVIRTYGEDLSDVQPRINGSVDRCEELWSLYESLPGSVEPRGTGGWFEPEAGSPEAEAQAEEDAAKQAAYDTWEAEAKAFDAGYDTWESAYELALSRIDDEMAGSIEDGGWRSFLDGLQQVLGWAALVAGVLALVFAGPFVAIAVAIGLAVLAVTVLQVFTGDADGWDVALAVLGVLPMGKIGMLFQRGNRLSFFGAAFTPLADFGQFRTITVVNRLSQGGGWGFVRAAFQNGNPQGLVDVWGRMTVGMSSGELDDLSNTVNSPVLSDTFSGLFQFGHSVVGTGLEYFGWVAQATGNESLTAQYPVLDILW